MKSHIKAAFVAAFAALSLAGSAQATTITFAEVPLVNGQLVTTQFAAFGIDLSDAVIFTEAESSDGFGITTANGAIPATIVFDDLVDSLTIEYIVLGNYQIGIFAFGPANELIDSFSIVPSDSEVGFFFAGSGIKTVQLVGVVGAGGISTLDFKTAGNPIPEPATWAMMIGGFGIVGGAMRRRRARMGIASA